MTGPLVVVGDTLLDRDLDGTVQRICPDAPVPVVDTPLARPRPGGAGLAAALATDDSPVVLVTALAADAAGEELARLLASAGVEIVTLLLDGSTPEKVRVRASGQTLLRLDYGGPPGRVGTVPAHAQEAIQDAGALLVADYGRGVAAHPELRAHLADAAVRAPLVWDPHPHGPAPIRGIRLATPSLAEASRLVADDQCGTAAAARWARRLATQWASAVAITLGDHGAIVADCSGSPLMVPVDPVANRDTCGAGDRFSSAAALALGDGALVSEAVEHAVACSGHYVAAGGAGVVLGDLPLPHRHWPRRFADAATVVSEVRRAGGTVVASGGCFDLLHAGHVSMLSAARRLGDCLVVCLNSDDSVRRLKGPDRPLQPATDRAAVLLALDCVDAVEIFDEDTPAAALDHLRPDLYTKGADYTVADLPETGVLARWGGQAIVLPYLKGRSATRLLKEATRRGA